MKFRFKPEDFEWQFMRDKLGSDFEWYRDHIVQLANWALENHEQTLPRVYAKLYRDTDKPDFLGWSEEKRTKDPETHTALLWGIEEIK